MNANAVEQAPEQEATEELGPGGALREARERKKLDVVSVANSLNLHRSIIEALEADDFRSLPEAIFVRGYLRNYSRMLGLPPEVMIARYEKANDLPALQTTSAQSERLRGVGEAPGEGGGASKLVVALVVVAVAVGGGLFWWSQNQGGGERAARSATPSTIEPAALPGNGEAAPTLALPEPVPEPAEAPVAVPEPMPLPVVEESPAEPVTEEPAVAEAEPTEPVPEPAPEVAPEVVETAEAAAEEAAVAEAATESPAEEETPAAVGAGGTQLRISFSEDCWSEVTDAEGTKLLFRIAKAGESVTVEGVAPIRVLFGRANAVTLEVDGLAFDLAPHSQANIARLTLGEIDPEADAAAAAAAANP